MLRKINKEKDEEKSQSQQNIENNVNSNESFYPVSITLLSKAYHKMKQ